MGAIAKETELTSLVEELLGARGATMTATRVDVLQEADFLNANRASDGSKIRIWITLARPGLVRIWFAAAGLDRYLWRDVPLVSGLDPVGREQIGQIVQSSAEALYQGDLGFTRSVAQRVWQEQQRELAAQHPNAQPVPRATEKAQRPIATPQVTIRAGRVVPSGNGLHQEPRRLKPFLGIGYTFARNAAELGWLHGPALTLGVNYALSRNTIGVLLSAEWHLAQHFTGELARLELQSKTGWLMLQWTDTRSAHAGLTGSVGTGIEFTHVEPIAREGTGFAAASAYTDRSYLTRLRAGLRGNLGRFAWNWNAGVDFSLSKTSYGVDLDQGYSSLLRLWQVRPGMEIAGSFE